MTMTEPVLKNIPLDKPVRDVFAMISDVDDGQAALETALLQLAVEKLHEHRDEIRAAGKKAIKSETKKFYRAVTKSALKTGDIEHALHLLSKAETVTIPEYTRRDGTVVAEHTRRLPEGHSPRAIKERMEIRRELREAEQSGQKLSAQQRRVYNLLGEIDSAAREVVGAHQNETYQGAMRSFLQESTIGKGITAVANFFSRTGGKIGFAATAIREFGPITGVRIAHAYFRYGGYDVPMSESNGRVVTAMDDKIPEAESAEKTRSWAINRLRERLPNRHADNAGAEPPSEGFIIDRNGHVLAHGVGRGNDYFLPFNNRHLRAMREADGVEYVRRRMFGGPTSEDLHAAMLMGVKRFTVLSNSGEFTVELTNRAHGLKIEHVQIVSRFQELLNKRTKLDFDAYRNVLSSLESEFPLHFNLENVKGGEWSGDHDRIGPKSRFMDDLRGLFGVDREIRTEQLRDDRGRILFPGQRAGRENVHEAFRRQVNANPSARASLLNQLENYYRKQGKDPSLVSLVAEQRAILQRQFGRPEVRTPSTSGEAWRDVTTRVATPDEVTRTAQDAQPRAAPVLPPKGRERIESLASDYGLDVSRPNEREGDLLKKLTRTALNDRAWEDFQNDPDAIQQLRRVYGT